MSGRPGRGGGARESQASTSDTDRTRLARVLHFPRQPVRVPPPALAARVLRELRPYVAQLAADEQRAGIFSRRLSLAIDWLVWLEEEAS